MAGLVPAIPVFSCLGHPNVDAPHKAGPQDGGVVPSAIKFDLDFIPIMYFYPAASSVEGVVDRDDRRRDRVGCPTTASRWSVGRRRASQEARASRTRRTDRLPHTGGLRRPLAKVSGRLPALHSPRLRGRRETGRRARRASENKARPGGALRKIKARVASETLSVCRISRQLRRAQARSRLVRLGREYG